MNTSTPIRTPGTGAGVGRPDSSYIYVAGSPRRARKRRRTLLLLVVSVAVLVPTGLQIHQASTAASTASRHQGVGPLTTGAGSAQPPPEPGSAQPPPEPGSIHPELSRAFGRAQAAARAAGVDLQITSGFRSVATQQRLYDRAIAKYGSAEKARRWVLPPDESDHVKGLAVDVGPRAAAAWLEKHGVRYGICRRYVNEWWHFERLAPAIGQRCPALEPYAGG